MPTAFFLHTQISHSTLYFKPVQKKNLKVLVHVAQRRRARTWASLARLGRAGSNVRHHTFSSNTELRTKHLVSTALNSSASRPPEAVQLTNTRGQTVTYQLRPAGTFDQLRPCAEKQSRGIEGTTRVGRWWSWAPEKRRSRLFSGGLLRVSQVPVLLGNGVYQELLVLDAIASLLMISQTADQRHTWWYINCNSEAGKRKGKMRDGSLKILGWGEVLGPSSATARMN
jgi:hypothetical protein